MRLFFHVAALTFWLYPGVFPPKVNDVIFINHQKSSKAAKDYYTQHIAPGDGRYYTEENAQQMKGVWHGRGAEMLQLSGEVKQEDFFRLCDNLTPDGKKLTARTDTDRRVMTDVTFDCSKSVTLAYELGGDDRILTAFRESVRETMAEMEANVQTRVRKNGADHDRTTGNMIWAEHIHRTARPVTKGDAQTVDPQLHAHATVFNATFDPVEKRWKAIQLGSIVRDKGYYQAAFHARLASKLKGVGYSIERDGNSFKLAGIDRATVEKFSQRHAVIKDEAERLGATDPESKAKIARRSREKKTAIPQSMEELRKEWGGRLTPEERLALKTARHGWDRGDATITPDQAKEYALEHSFQKASAVSEKRLQAEALTYAVGSVLPEDVADIAQHPEVISKTRDGQLMTTTKTVLRDELAMLQFAKDGQRKFKPLVSCSVKSNNSEIQPDLSGLSEEQKKAALHIVNSRDTVTGVVGKAGTGKTRMMRATRDAIESEPGRHVFAFAPSSQASRGVLAKEGFKDAETLAMLLKNEKLQDKTKGQILWIDEAGLVSSKDMRALMDIARKNGNRVILSGDYTQHSSVEAGDAFRLLEKEAGVKLARLTEIRRQTVPGYKKAVEQISSGTSAGAQKGFDALDKMGWVVEASGEDRHRALVKDYLSAADEGKSALIIAPTHAEGQRLTDELRVALKERGGLGAEHQFIARKSTGWTDAQKGDVRNYDPGMVVEFHQNAKGFARGENNVVAQDDTGLYLQKTDGSRTPLPLAQTSRFDVFRTREIGIAKGDRIRITKNGEAKLDGEAKGARVNNGDVFTVEGFTKEGDIRLEKGKLLSKTWGHLSLGYVDTSYASQGKTVDRVFIATGNESLPAVGQQQWYVSTSRGREMAKVYVDSKEDVRDAIARTGQRLSAVELTHTKLRPSWRHRFNQSLERNRVSRFLKQRAAQITDYWRGCDGVRYA
jgi:conjugative relaxase-like TrwC/TraI family protein